MKNNFKISDIKAVAFDIDGTLYRPWKLNLRMSIHFLCHSIFFLHYGIARKELRKLPADKNFVQLQDQIMAKRLKCTEEEAHKKLDKIVYTGLKKYFSHIKPCKGVVELIKKLKANGYKIALLSDFPPEQKGDTWGLLEYCDVVLGSEDVGALKPAKEAFEDSGLDMEQEDAERCGVIVSSGIGGLSTIETEHKKVCTRIHFYSLQFTCVQALGVIRLSCQKRHRRKDGMLSGEKWLPLRLSSK